MRLASFVLFNAPLRHYERDAIFTEENLLCQIPFLSSPFNYLYYLCLFECCI